MLTQCYRTCYGNRLLPLGDARCMYYLLYRYNAIIRRSHEEAASTSHQVSSIPPVTNLLVSRTFNRPFILFSLLPDFSSFLFEVLPSPPVFPAHLYFLLLHAYFHFRDHFENRPSMSSHPPTCMTAVTTFRLIRFALLFSLCTRLLHVTPFSCLVRCFCF